MSPSCPACRSVDPSRLTETYTDPIYRAHYDLYTCPRCAIVFSDPRVAVGADWYARSSMQEGETPPHKDWRYGKFLAEPMPGKHLLDFGCGRGHFISLAQKQGYEATGFDFNSDHVEQAKRAGAKEVWVMDERTFLQTHQGRYDAVTLFDVLEHLPEPAEALEGIFKLLVPGGCVVISVPNGERPVPCAYLREEFDYPPYHFTRWSAKTFKIALERIGYRVEKIEWSYMPRTYFSGLIYYRILRNVFPFLKRVLFGLNRDQAQKTWKTLLETPGSKPSSARDFLADANLRQRLVDTALFLFCLMWLPIEWPLIAALNLWHPQFGRQLYVLARKPADRLPVNAK